VLTRVAAVLALGLVVVAGVDAGSTPVTASKISVTRQVELGVAASIAFTLRKGKNAVANARPKIVATKGKDRVTAAARRLGRGRYAAVIRPRATGRWSLEARVGARALRLGAIPVVRPRLVEAYKAVVDADGALLVADGGHGGGRLVRVDPRSGSRVVVAGNGGDRFAAAGRDATAAPLGRIYSVALSPAGEIYVLVDNRIVKLSRGRIEVVAGDGRDESAGDGGPAKRASLSDAIDIAFGPGGDLFVTEATPGRVRRIDAESGTISTVTRAVARPFKLAFAHDGSLLVTQLEPGRVARVDRNGDASTFLANVAVVTSIVPAESGSYLFSQHPPMHGAPGDIVRVDSGGNRTAVATGKILEPTGLARADDGTVYVTSFSVPLGRVDLATGTITPLR
jgi:sugar lactone lactonase YvrE